MENIQQNESGRYTATLKGRFTFSDHEKFLEIVNNIKNGDTKTVTIDLSSIEFVDSAALGMLLLARDEAEKKQIKVELRGAQGQVAKMFKVSKFDTLFNIT